MESETKIKNLISSYRTYLNGKSKSELVTCAEFKDLTCQQHFRHIQLLFPLAFAIHSLAFTGQPSSTQLKWLQQEQSENSTYNYWIRESKGTKEQTLPDDVDDAAVAHAALLLSGQDLRTEFILSTVPLETKTGGPYTTWYFPQHADKDGKWQDIDPMVNANFVYTCGLAGIYPKNAIEYVAKCLTKDTIKSPYYPFESIFLLYASRAASSDAPELKGLKTSLENYIQAADTTHLSFPETLFLLLAKLNIGMTVSEQEFENILNNLDNDGLPPTFPICYGFPQPNTGAKSYVGSKVISVSLMLELCFLYNLQIPATGNPNPNTSIKKKPALSEAYDFNHLKRIILNKTDKKNRQALTMTINGYQDSRIPKLMSIIFQSLDIKSSPDLAKFTASLFSGWIAYHELDDLIDRTDYDLVKGDLDKFLDNKDIQQLKSVSLKILSDISVNYSETMNTSFQATDEFYVWEINNLRFDPHGQPVNQLINKFETGYEYILERVQAFSEELRILTQMQGLTQHKNNLISAVEHLFVIQQINDDAHDWKEDLLDGVFTYTNIRLISLLIEAYPQVTNLPTAEIINFKSTKNVFWEDLMPELYNLCRFHLECGKNAASKLPNPRPATLLLEKAFAPIALYKQSAEETSRIVENLPR